MLTFCVIQPLKCATFFWVLRILPFVYNSKTNGCPLWGKEEVTVFGNWRNHNASTSTMSSLVGSFVGGKRVRLESFVIVLSRWHQYVTSCTMDNILVSAFPKQNESGHAFHVLIAPLGGSFGFHMNASTWKRSLKWLYILFQRYKGDNCLHVPSKSCNGRYRIT